jgi:hypothetical protein
MAYDPIDQEVVLFGGIFRSNGPTGNWTWTWSGGVWTNRTDPNASSPPARFSPSFAFDPRDDGIVLFGGMTQLGGALLNDTWSYQAGTWREVLPLGDRAPPPRQGSALAFDYIDNYLVLFGGTGSGSYLLNDTWAYSSANWTQVVDTPVGPPLLDHPREVSQPGSVGVLLVGCLASAIAADEVWSFSGGAWQRGNSNGYPADRPECEGVLASGPTPESAVLVASTSQVVCGASTWSYDPSGWAPAPGSISPGPCQTWGASAVYDPSAGKVVLFGGSQNFVLSNQTWTYSNGTWTNVTATAGNAPSPRVYAGIAYDAADGYDVLFGGFVGVGCTNFAGNHYCSDTWIFNRGGWENITSWSTSHPSARFLPSLAYDVDDRYVVLFGGTQGSQADLGDTWAFQAGNWSHPLGGGSGPPPRQASVMSYDPNEGCVLMFGGFYYSGPIYEALNDSWCYSNGTWALLFPTTSPPPTQNAGMTFDPAWGVMVLAGGGGVNPAVGLPGGVWTFNGTTWAEYSTIPSTYSPLPTNYSALVFDPANASLLLIAGTQDMGTMVPAWSLGSSLRLDAFTASASIMELGDSVQFAVQTSGGSSWLRYDYSGLPPGCQTASTATLHCVPSSAPGNVSVGVRVTDAATRLSLGANVSVEIVRNPLITGFNASPAGTDVGRRVTLVAVFEGGAPPLTFEYSGLPEGCAPTAGPILNCTPDRVGTFEVGVNATDALGMVATATTTLEVRPDPWIESLTARPSVVDAGQNVSIGSVTHNGTLPYRYSYSGLPGGCRPLVGGPYVNCSMDAVGQSMITVSVVDAVGYEVSATTFLTVNARPQVLGFIASERPVFLGNETTLLVSVTGGTAPLSFNYSGLPTGCAGSDAAATHCTPTEIGNYTPTVLVRDSTGAVAVANTSISVENPPPAAAQPQPTPPSSPGPSPLSVLLAALAAAAGAVWLAVIVIWTIRLRNGEAPPRPPTGRL